MSSTLQSIANAVPSLGRARVLINSSDDVVIVSAVRTPITKVRKAARHH
jgi:acetyl-CoA acyltransferase 1